MHLHLLRTTAVGNANNLGFEGTVGNNLAAVLGSATGPNEFEVFTNGFEAHGAVAGQVLLLHPGDGQFAVARYTISADDLIGATADAGDDQIDFSFIDAVDGGSMVPMDPSHPTSTSTTLNCSRTSQKSMQLIEFQTSLTRWMLILR